MRIFYYLFRINLLYIQIVSIFYLVQGTEIYVDNLLITVSCENVSHHDLSAILSLMSNFCVSFLNNLTNTLINKGVNVPHLMLTKC